jgi:hypothetical protein
MIDGGADPMRGFDQLRISGHDLPILEYGIKIRQ